jgi:protein-S-isoprenylcysteine O-methyltransferase Ste14
LPVPFRWIALASLLGCFAISTHYRKRARREGGTIPRRRERPLLIAGRVLVAAPLFGGVLVYVVHPGGMAWSALPIPEWARWGGAMLGMLMVPAAYWVFSTIGRNVSETVLTKEHHELVTAGPYRLVRHPLYATGIGLFTAVGLMAANWFILLFALIALVAIRLGVVPVEERELVAKFGQAYRVYAGATGALLPRLIGRRPPPR